MDCDTWAAPCQKPTAQKAKKANQVAVTGRSPIAHRSTRICMGTPTSHSLPSPAPQQLLLPSPLLLDRGPHTPARAGDGDAQVNPTVGFASGLCWVCIRVPEGRCVMNWYCSHCGGMYWGVVCGNKKCCCYHLSCCCHRHNMRCGLPSPVNDDESMKGALSPLACLLLASAVCYRCNPRSTSPHSRLAQGQRVPRGVRSRKR